jgi:hypothetical protein
MRDRDVRDALHSKVLKDHHGDPDTLVLDELGLRHGTCRVDVAVVNGYLHGFEIKSDADTLERLSGQVAIYNAVLDQATLVVGERHVEKAKPKLPQWWGIKVATAKGDHGIEFEDLRSPELNADIDAVALAELLWRPEAAEILRERGAPERLLKRPRAALYGYMAETIELSELRGLIRQRLKSRARWRGQRPPSTDADL